MNTVIFNSKNRLLKTKDSHFQEVFFRKCKSRPKNRVEAISNDETIGNATGSSAYDYRNVIKLESVTFEGAEFIQWSDDDKNHIRRIEVLEDSALTSQFQKKTDKCVAYYLPNKDYVNP